MRVNKLDNETIVKIMMGFVIGPLILGAIIFSKLLSSVILFFIALGMFIEWYEMTKSDMKYLISGLPIIAIPIASLFSIMLFIDDTKYLFLTYAVIICTIDTFAMFGGRAIGGPKLAPTISPQKTVAGLCVGVISSMIIVQALTFLPNYDFPYHGWSLSLFAGILSVVAQISDLFISYFKRHFGLKDTGNIIPGHGGILDRFDSIIFTAPILLYVVL